MVKKPKYMQTEEITTEVRPQGNGACAYLPKTWLGKKVKVTVLA
jgi:putative transposon-encoded protein